VTKGAVIAIELISNGDSQQPNTRLTQAIIANAAQYALILLACGFFGNVFRFLPVLTISDEIISEGLDNFSRLFASLIE
jgi:4-aminobutyrate aminotransferase/(S)-3-amino-2-methylpropionate transaminase